SELTYLKRSITKSRAATRRSSLRRAACASPIVNRRTLASFHLAGFPCRDSRFALPLLKPSRALFLSGKKTSWPRASRGEIGRALRRARHGRELLLPKCPPAANSSPCAA